MACMIGDCRHTKDLELDPRGLYSIIEKISCQRRQQGTQKSTLPTLCYVAPDFIIIIRITHSPIFFI